MRERFDPGFDFDFGTQGGLCAAMVDWSVEKDLQCSAEGGSTRAGEAYADDLDFGTRSR